MKHETTLYRGEAAIAYAKCNLGAYLQVDPWLEALIGEGRWECENDTEPLQEIFAAHGTEGFTICGGVSDAHDEAFFCWLACERMRPFAFTYVFNGFLR